MSPLFARPLALAHALVAGLVLAAVAATPATAAPGTPVGDSSRPAGAVSVPGELIVGYRPGTSAQPRRVARAAGDVALEQRLEAPGLELVTVTGGGPLRPAAADLEARPEVLYAEPNYYRELARVPSDPLFGQLWGLLNLGGLIGGLLGLEGADIGATRAWSSTTGSEAVSVAVVDDGVDHAHADLRGNIWTNPGESGAGRESNGLDDDGNGRVDDWRGWDFVGADNDPAPGGSSYHGTHVAGTIGAQGNNGIGIAGVNWDVGLMPLRVFDADGRTTVARLVNAYAYASASGARVVNGSYGGGGYSQTERNAIAAAPETMFVIAAGNDGSNNDASADYPCSYPLENVVCVAASDARDRLASFSNRGAASVDLAAPGVGVLSTLRNNSYGRLSGTSMATPHVAGAAGLLWSADPAASVAKVRAGLLAGVDRVPVLAGKVASGGRLNLDRSLAALGGETPGGDDPPPAARPPATRILVAPPRRTKLRRAAFRFRATADSTFRCRLDRRPWRRCAPPKRFKRVGTGRHVFRVRAIDGAGNREPKPERWVWRVARRR